METQKSLRRVVFEELTKYVVVGSAAASAAYFWTTWNRNPDRALAALPAGAVTFEAATLTCDETAFMSETVNMNISTNLTIPDCNEPLDPDTMSTITNELKSATSVWKNERISYLEKARDRLTALNSQPEIFDDDGKLKAEVELILSDLRYIFQSLPRQLNGRGQLDWGIRNTSNGVDNLKRELTQIEELIQVCSGQVINRLERQFQFYLVVSNSSDIGQFVSTHCHMTMIRKEGPNLQLKLEIVGVGDETLPKTKLAYYPINAGQALMIKLNANLEKADALRLQDMLLTQQSIDTRIQFETSRTPVRTQWFLLNDFLPR